MSVKWRRKQIERRLGEAIRLVRNLDMLKKKGDFWLLLCISLQKKIGHPKIPFKNIWRSKSC